MAPSVKFAYNNKHISHLEYHWKQWCKRDSSILTTYCYSKYMLKRIAWTYKWDILIHRLQRHERHDVFVGLFSKIQVQYLWTPKANIDSMDSIE